MSTARTSRRSAAKAPASLVSFLERSFADQSAHTPFLEFSAGDIGVLANCKSLSVFDVRWCPGITGKVLGTFFREPSAYLLFCDFSSGDIKVLEHCPNIKDFRGGLTSITGECSRILLSRTSPLTLRSANVLQVISRFLSTARTSRRSGAAKPASLVSFLEFSFANQPVR